MNTVTHPNIGTSLPQVVLLASEIDSRTSLLVLHD
jgi:hypothetical protein